MKIPLEDYKQLLQRYLAPQRDAVLLMSALLLAGILLQLAGPQVARSFIDSARSGTAEGELVRLAFVFISLSIFQRGMSVLAAYWSERVAWTATNRLRADIAGHLVRLDLSFHKAHPPGELIERVDGDVNALAEFFSSFVVQLIGSGLLLIGVLVAVYLQEVRLGLAFTVFSLLTLALLGWVRKYAAPHWQDDRQHSAEFYGFIGELLSATEDIRSSGAIPYAMRHFFERLRRWMPVKVRAELLSSAVWMAAIAAFAFGDVMAIGLSGGLFQAGKISLGTVYMVLSYTAMLAGPIETIRTQIQDLQRADAAISRIQGLQRVQSRLADGTELFPSGALSVEFRKVSFGHEDSLYQNGDGADQHQAVLENISFHLEAGQVLGLLGRTGSGKTTLARLLFRMYDPQQGEIRLGDVNLRRANLKALRARVGLVTQDVQIFESSLRDNLTFFDPEIPDPKLLDVLEKLGLKGWLGRLPEGLDSLISAASLSAGEAQLLALARVFLRDPGLVILDEASSRIDPASEALLERALDLLLKGRTAVVIAHRLATLQRADELLILENGRILEAGSQQLLSADRHSRFSRLQNSGLGEILV